MPGAHRSEVTLFWGRFKLAKKNRILSFILSQQIIIKLLNYEEAIFYNFHNHFYLLQQSRN